MLCMLISAVPFMALADDASGIQTQDVYPEENGWLNANPNAPADYAYSIAVVGDTQFVVEKDLMNGTDYMSDIYGWIADNVDDKNIQYVLGVGDITQYSQGFTSGFAGQYTYDDEWTHAMNAITLLNDKVPYSLCRGGGHDKPTQFNQYLTVQEYYMSNLSGTYKANDVTSTYSTFEIGGIKYLILALDWDPGDAILAWADGIISANPDRKVIVTTHAYLAADCTFHGSQANHVAVPENNNGEDIWNKLVSKHDNIQLVISGHDPSANLVYRQDVRDSGSVVTSLLVDPQVFDSQNEGETGLVCMLYFSDDGNNVNVEWYSTVRDQYYKSVNQFSLNLNEKSADDGSVVTKYGTVPATYADANEYPFVSFKINGDGTYTFQAADANIFGSSQLMVSARNVPTVILMRRDFTVPASTEFGNLGFAQNNIIDFGGYTLTAEGLPIKGATKNASEKNITYKNGTIITSVSPYIQLSGYGSGAGYGFNLTFENIVFKRAEGATNQYPIYKVSYSTNGHPHSLVFNNCTFDMRGTIPTSGLILFTAGQEKSDTVNVTVNGGSIIADNRRWAYSHKCQRRQWRSYLRQI